MKFFLMTLFLVLSLSSLNIAYAKNKNVELPTWAEQGDVKTEINSKGKNASEVLTAVVVLIAILGMLAGAGFFAFGNSDMGKKLIFGGIIGLVIAGSVYGIAAIFIS